jgi:transcriptional regulator with XRE-family HTH domain
MGSTLATRIGNNIAAIRKARLQTQATIAEKSGIDPISLSRIERGAALPGLATLDKLAAALDVSLGRLLDGASSNLPTLADAVLRELEPLPEEDRLFLLDQLHSWAQKLQMGRRE